MSYFQRRYRARKTEEEKEKIKKLDRENKSQGRSLISTEDKDRIKEAEKMRKSQKRLQLIEKGRLSREMRKSNKKKLRTVRRLKKREIDR